MPTCDRCGERIEFRNVDGQPTPIHVGGAWCGGVKISKKIKAVGWFKSAEAFTDPNALCPVCGAMVFYYQNSSGSRVFFDNLGWPWPKHSCTDVPASQTGKIKRPHRRKKSRISAAVRPFVPFELAHATETDGILTLKFRNLSNPLIVRTLRLAVNDLRSQGWSIEDIKDAPSFLIRRRQPQTVLEFISARKGCVGKISVPAAPRL